MFATRWTCSRVRPFSCSLLLLLALPASGTAQQGAAAELALPQMIEATLQSHPSSDAAAARVEGAYEAREAVRASRLPNVSLGAELTRFAEPMVIAPLHAFDPTSPPGFDRTLVRSQLLVRYLVFDGGRRGAEINDAEAQLSGAGHLGDDVTAALIEATAAAYLEVLSARSMRDAAQSLVRALEAELGRVSLSLSAGTAAELEVLRANAALQDATAKESTAEVRAQSAERALARITGIPTETISSDDLSRPSIDALRLPYETRRTPMVLAAESSVEAAEARVQTERSRLVPQVEVEAGWLDFGTAAGDHVLEWQAGLRASWPLFTGGATRAAVRRAEADLSYAQAGLDVARLRAEQEVDAAEAALLDALGRARSLDASVAQWEEVARIEALALDAGSGIQSDLLTAQAGLFQARAGLAQAESDAALAAVTLARARGELDQTWIDRVWGNPI